MRILHRNCRVFTCVLFLLVSFNIQAKSPLSNARMALNFVVYPIVGPDTIPPVIVSLNSNIYLDANGNVNISPGEIASISDSSQLDTVIIDRSTFSCQDLGNNTVNITASDAAGGQTTGNFITTTGIVNGSQRTVMAVGDPNNDGIDDVLLTNSFYKNNGTGTFFSSQNLSAGAGQNGGVVGDLNGDGNDDLINGMYVYLWNGSFMVYKEYLGPTDAVFGNPTLVDLDGDGDLDLYRPSYYQNPERVFLNDGTGSFTLDSSYAAGSFQICATSGDFDEDGDMDIIAAGYYNVYFAQNDGNAKLSYTSIHSNGNYYINRIYATDINNDGHLDLVYSNCCSAFEYMLGNGDGTFGNPVPVIGTHSNGSRSISIGDYEGDGDIDVLEVGAEIVLWKNDGNANFQEQLTGFTGYLDAVMGDFNGDGVQDIAASRNGPGLVSISEVSTSNTSIAAVSLTILDTIAPVVVTQDVNLLLDSNGSASISIGDINNGSFDNCGIESISLSQTSFSCSDLGKNLVSLTITDSSGNVASSTAQVIISDTMAPLVTPIHATVYLDGNGNVSVSANDVATVSDNCGIDTVSLDVSDFDCTDLGVNTVLITAKDASGAGPTGNFITTTGIVNGSQRTVMAVGDPNNDGIDDILLTNSFYKNNGTGTFFSSQNLSAGAGQNGGVVGDLNGDGNDDLINGMYVYLWNGSSMVYKEYLGPTDAVFGNPTLADLDGDGDLDLYRPSYYQNPERVFLNDGTGSFTLDSSYAAGSFQICATSGDFDEDGDIDIIAAGYYNVYFAQNDGNAKLSYTSIHSNGNFYINRIYATDINNDGHLDLVYSNCCSAFEYMLGNGDGTFGNPIPVIGTHSNGSRSISIGDYEGDGDIDVLEVGAEIVLWKNDGNANFQEQLTGFTGYLDAVMGDFNGDGVQDIAASRNGPGLVSISETSIGNSATATANLNVLDTISPVVVVQNVTLQLDANGTTQATVSDIDNSSYDNCTIDSLWTSGAQLSFDCSDLGNSYLVTLHARDLSGNTASMTATVTIADDSHPCNQPPIALCQNLTIYTNANCMGAFSALSVNNGSYDPDGDSLVYNIIPAGPLVIGVHNILLTVTDPLGESSSCNATITVLDSTSPVVATQDITVYLDAFGSASIVAADINNGSSDICGIASTSIDVSSFGCANVGANNVILTVIDNNGNSATGSASVIIIDSISPIASCQNLTLALGANGLVDLNPAMIDNGSSDACGIASITVSPLSFTCNEVGSNIVTLTVTDVNGNISNCQSTVTVIDTIVPFVLTQNVSIVLDNLGNASVSAADIDAGSADACGIASTSLDITSFGCNDLGNNVVILTVTDVNGNVSQESALVTVSEGYFVKIAHQPDLDLNCNTGAGGRYVTWDVPEVGTYSSCAADTCRGGESIPGFIFLGEYNGHRYFCSDNSNYTWNQANAAAQAAGGHLAVINDANENHYIACRVQAVYSWIGLTDETVEGQFDWVNGDPLSYTKWSNYEPNNTGGYNCGYGTNGMGADYAVLKRWSGKWYDRRDCNKHEFIMEMPCGNDVVLNQVAGPSSGSLFAQGTTTVTYVAIDTVTGASDTSSFNVTVGDCTPVYCTSNGNCSSYEWINRIKLSGVDNTSGNDNGYGDYTNLIAHAKKNKKVNFKLYPGFSGSKYKEYWRIFVDWNNDGDFYDYKECVYQGKSKNTKSGSFKVPSWASAGTLRVRVVMKWGGYGGPCSNFSYGEVEDYSLIIDNASGGGVSSKTRGSIVDNTEEINTINQELFNLYPNPVLSGGIMTLNIRSATEESIELNIMSANGQLIQTQKVDLREGLNSIEVKPGTISTGAYFIQISNSNESIPFVVKF